MRTLVNGVPARRLRAVFAAVLLFSMVALPSAASAAVSSQPSMATIQGTITDPDGLPVGQAAIYVYRWDGVSAYEVVHAPDDPWNDWYAMTLGGDYTPDGTYSFEIEPGTYKIMFADPLPDYQNRDWTFVREFYPNANHIGAASNLVVAGGGTYTYDAVVAFEEYGTGAGMITDSATGAGTYDVGVNFYRENGFGTGWEWVQGGGSNSLGDWMTETIPSGTYKVQFVDDYGRYVSQWYGDTDFASSPLVYIAPNHVTPGIDASMDRTSVITGTLTGQYSVPSTRAAEGVRPLAYRWDEGEAAWMEANDTALQMPTDASGNYVINGLEPGDYKIRFVPDPAELAYCKYWVDQVYGAPDPAKFSPSMPADWTSYPLQLDEGTTITVGANSDVEGIDEYLAWGTFIEGVVTYAVGGAPVPNYHVTAFDDTGLVAVADTWTNASGTWVIRNLDNSVNYKARFDDESDVYGYSAEPGFFYNTEWYNSGGNSANAGGGQSLGGNVGGVNAQIDATANWGRISGRVSDMHQGRSLEGMSVGLCTFDGVNWTEVDSTWTDAGGNYSFTRVPAGAYPYVRVRAYQSDDPWEVGLDIGRVYDEAWSGGYDLADLDPNHGVLISAGATATGNIQMPLTPISPMDGYTEIGGIYGLVTAQSGGAAVPGAPVTFYQYGGEGEWWYVGQKATDSTGYYCTGLAAGEYRLQFGPTVALADEYYNDTQDFSAAATVSIVATPGAYAVANAALGPALTISGTVRDGSGAALAGAEARAYTYDAEYDVWAPVSFEEAGAEVGAAVALTNASGAYTIGGLKPGIAYKVGFSKTVEGDIYPPDWTQSYWRSGGTASSVDQAGQITMSVAGTTSINGTLTAGSYVRGSLVDQDGKRVGEMHVKLWQKGPGDQWNQINSTYSSGQGDFQFEAFGAGDYMMEFIDDTNLLYGHRWYPASDDTSAAAELITFTGGDAKVITATVEAVDTAYSPIYGATRYDTAVLAAYEAFPMGASTVVISTGQNWPDALGGSALAGAYDGPMLLVGKDAMPSAVGDCIEDLGANKAIIIGGSSAVTTLVATQIASRVGGMSHVTRIAGATRYETANLVAEATIARLGSAYDGTAFVATGGNFPDALGASPLAAAASWPIYLASPTAGMSAATMSRMNGYDVDTVLILGGTGAVSASVETSLNDVFGDANVDRLQGGNRYETAAVIAEYGVDNVFGLGWNNVAFATGVNFPDALAGGVLQGMTGSVMLLTGSSAVDPYVSGVLTDHKATIAEVRFLGGENAVTPAVRTQIYTLLN